MAKRLNLIYGLSAENKIVHISEVVSGKACNCTCPSCNTPLVAKKGNVKVPHFAHQSTETCEYGYETSLHMAAKEILLRAKTMILPEAVYKFKGMWKTKQISPEREIRIDRVELESKTGDVIPDVIVYSGDEKIFVEIFVTHKVDEDKLKKIQGLNVSTLEMDLSKQRDVLAIEELEERLIGNNKNKYWVYHSEIDAYEKTMYSVAKKKRVFEDDWSNRYFTRGCPLRIFKMGKYYCAHDCYCYDCQYHIEEIEKNGETKYIYCTGEALIGDASDFNISFEERRKKCIEWIQKEDLYYIKDEICPFCYGFLRIKERESEKVIECDDCDFTAVYNKKAEKLNVKTSSHKRRFEY